VQKYLTFAHFIDGQMGDFQVATDGGFWVAAGVNRIRYLLIKLSSIKLDL
jgi:hypothetical protein